MSAIRIAVIGAGHMGRLHTHKVATLCERTRSVSLVGVAEVDPERRRAVAAEAATHAVADYRELIPHADAAIVAVPTVKHFEVVRDALKAGLDVLVEKPIAATPREGEELLRLARSGERVLHVGHLEWFNAALHGIREHVQRPHFVEALRMGVFPDRSTDIDVVRDVMIHDIDILQNLLGEEPERIESIGVRVISREVDIANARLTFPGGCVASLTASRVSSSPVRRLRVFQRDAYFSIDFLDQTAVALRRRVGARNGTFHIEREPLHVAREDALLSQLRAFVRSVESRDASVVRAEEALGALRTALRLIEAMPALDDPR